MCIRDSFSIDNLFNLKPGAVLFQSTRINNQQYSYEKYISCLLYTSDAADERSSVDLGGRRIIKKKTDYQFWCTLLHTNDRTQRLLRICSTS